MYLKTVIRVLGCSLPSSHDLWISKKLTMMTVQTPSTGLGRWVIKQLVFSFALRSAFQPSPQGLSSVQRRNRRNSDISGWFPVSLEDTDGSGRSAIVICFTYPPPAPTPPPAPWHSDYNLKSLAFMANGRQGRKQWSVYSLQMYLLYFIFFEIWPFRCGS